MVEIRKLQPSFRIAMPERVVKPRRGTNARRDQVIRRLKDFPPPTPQPTPCRLWQGALDGNGYGKRRMKIPDGTWQMRAMHRWVVEQVLGRRLRKDEVVLHACDQPLCYRYDHLSIGTIASNNADARRKGRAKKPPVNRLRGEANGRNKVPTRAHRVIVRRFLDGDNMITIAKDYGVSHTTISRILRTAPWPDLDRIPHHARRLAAERSTKETHVPDDDVPRPGPGGGSDPRSGATEAEADPPRPG